MFGGIKVNEYWRKQYNKGIMQMFGDLDILSLVRISRLNWIGHVNRKNSKRKVSQVFNKNPQGSRIIGQPNVDGGTVYKHLLTNTKLQSGKRGQNRAD
jgi:hypothetical protein